MALVQGKNIKIKTDCHVVQGMAPDQVFKDIFLCNVNSSPSHQDIECLSSLLGLVLVLENCESGSLCLHFV
jgi:hypothetical protein